MCNFGWIDYCGGIWVWGVREQVSFWILRMQVEDFPAIIFNSPTCTYKGSWQNIVLHLHFSLEHKEKKKKRCCPLDDIKLPMLERSVKSVHFKTYPYSWCKWYLQIKEWWHLQKNDVLATHKSHRLEDILPFWRHHEPYPDCLNSVSVPVLYFSPQ